MQRKIEFSDGEYYHVYNRGVEKRETFIDQRDYERFLRLLFLSNGTKSYVYRSVQGVPLNEIDRGEQLTAIGAYVLMPNHFHLLLKETSGGGISKFMEKLTTGYSMYFNKKNKRVGPLFQGPFKAQHVDRDEYLKYLLAYIHLNPVKLIDSGWKENGIKDRSAAKKYLAGYRYSSYPDYLGEKREEVAILARKEFPEYFTNERGFEDFIDDWLLMRAKEETLV
jgi:putative transposase